MHVQRGGGSAAHSAIGTPCPRQEVPERLREQQSLRGWIRPPPLALEKHHNETPCAGLAHPPSNAGPRVSGRPALCSQAVPDDTVCPPAAGTASAPAPYRLLWPVRPGACPPRAAPHGAAVQVTQTSGSRTRPGHTCSAQQPVSVSTHSDRVTGSAQHVSASGEHRHNTAPFFQKKPRTETFSVKHCSMRNLRESKEPPKLGIIKAVSAVPGRARALCAQLHAAPGLARRSAAREPGQPQAPSAALQGHGGVKGAGNLCQARAAPAHAGADSPDTHRNPRCSKPAQVTVQSERTGDSGCCSTAEPPRQRRLGSQRRANPPGRAGGKR